MSHEQIEAVPGCCHDEPNAKPPRTVSSSENDDGHINQRLEEVQNAELRNKVGRHRQGQNEDSNSNSNRHASQEGPAYRALSHPGPYGEAGRIVPGFPPGSHPPVLPEPRLRAAAALSRHLLRGLRKRPDYLRRGTVNSMAVTQAQGPNN